ncbi:hypothetical protein ACTXT7_009304 [Hymenolepis weldensis]
MLVLNKKSNGKPINSHAVAILIVANILQTVIIFYVEYQFLYVKPPKSHLEVVKHQCHSLQFKNNSKAAFAFFLWKLRDY